MIERLELNPTEYRVKLSDDDLMILGVAIWVLLQSETSHSNETIDTSLELASILRKVRGDRARWSIKMAKKIEQKLKRKPLLKRKK